MPQLQIRAMQTGDLTTVSQLGIASKAHWGYGPEEMAVFSGELTLEKEDLESLLIAEVMTDGEEIVGYYTIRQHADGITELEHLFVRIDRLRQGLGTTLLNRAMRQVQDLGKEVITIIADPNSAGFYERSGAVKVGDHHSSIAGRTIPIFEMAPAN